MLERDILQCVEQSPTLLEEWLRPRAGEPCRGVAKEWKQLHEPLSWNKRGRTRTHGVLHQRYVLVILIGDVDVIHDLHEQGCEHAGCTEVSNAQLGQRRHTSCRKQKNSLSNVTLAALRVLEELREELVCRRKLCGTILRECTRVKLLPKRPTTTPPSLSIGHEREERVQSGAGNASE